MSLTHDVALLLVRDLNGLSRGVGSFPDDEKLWHVPAGVTNSAGNLALHVAGNLQHFIGALLGHTGYVRNRDVEFATSTGSRGSVQMELQRAADAVTATLAQLDEGALSQAMPGAPNGLVTRIDLFLLHLVAHTAFHLGQAGYVRRIVCGDPVSAGPLPLDVLASSF